MIIDAILDRKDGDEYTAEEMRYMYDQATFFGHVELARALDGGDNAHIVEELCKYIDNEEYNPEIKKYVRSVDWVAA